MTAVAGVKLSHQSMRDALIAFQRMQLANATFREQLYREIGSDPLQLQVVLALAAHGAMPIGQLRSMLSRPSATMTSVTDRLLTRGWIERGASQSDRRSVVVTLTRSGEKAAAAVHDAYGAILHRAFSSEELSDAVAVFERVGSALRAELS